MIDWEGMLIDPNDVMMLDFVLYRPIRRRLGRYNEDDEDQPPEDDDTTDQETGQALIFLRTYKLSIKKECTPVVFEMLKTAVKRAREGKK